MLPSQSYSPQTQLKSVKQAFLSLVDSMQYLQRTRELEKKIDEATEQGEKRLVALETLKLDISDDISKLKDVLGEARANELSKQVASFVSAAIDQTKQRINQETQKQLSALTSDRDSEKTKTVKSVEAFLSTSPLPLITRTIRVDSRNGAYASSARYRCQDNIEYEFSLDTKMNSFFKNQCRLGVLDRTLRIPIGLGRSWLKKEPVPDFRSLEHYVVADAEATDTSLIVESSDEDSDAKLKLVYTKHGDHTSLSLSHSSGGVTTDITSEPGLNVHLDSDAFVRLMERLWMGVNELEKRKTTLTKVLCDNVSILENLECAEFFVKSWEAIAPNVKAAIKPGGDKRGDESLDSDTVSEKLKVLGSDALQIANILGVELKV